MVRGFAARLLSLGAALALTLGVAYADEEKVVHVYNWSDYIDNAVLEAFEKETGIKVVYDTYDSNDTLETKLLTGKTGYDVVVPSSHFLARQIAAGVFMKLDKSKLPNWKNLDASILERVAIWDEGNSHAVPYMWGTTGFAYNVAKIKERMPDAPVDSFRMMFDPDVVSKFKDCGVYLMDEVDEVHQVVLNYLGEDGNSHDAKVLAKVVPVLKSVRPYVTKFHNSAQIDALANGDICLTMGYSGDMLQARNRAIEAKNGVQIEYVIPKEGTLMWFDMMAVPADAPHPNNAHAFIDFLMRPDMIAKASNVIFYANGNAAATPLVDPAITGDPAIYPTPEVMQKLFVVTPYGAKLQRTVTRQFASVKGNQ
ncbi:MAG: polyamine ABC transporter substrate-binding protein [Alphaproteobacteria bacterium]|nr:polyamine ABC transporter substrate-binding protein [Alphaproteobacteria bacterium]